MPTRGRHTDSQVFALGTVLTALFPHLLPPCPTTSLGTFHTPNSPDSLPIAPRLRLSENPL